MASIAGLRYITPLFELARERDVIEEVAAGIKAFSLLMQESPELESTLLNPRVPVQKKKQILLKLTEEHFLPLLRDFFCLLVDKRREHVFLFLEQEFSRLLRESKNVVSAVVESPVPLEEEYRQTLTQRFEAATGKTVELEEKINPELIAGARILLGSRMLDGSLKARLEGIKRHLIQSRAAKAD
ncbi:MAG: ATP synthase F1 subunit delta [Planctomycetota bacterium]|jgi:F-type H+-transporting ATPase subunit delta